MNSITKAFVVGAACFAACAVVRAETPGAGNTVTVESQTVGPAPSPEYVWMAGHWNSDAGQWKWIAGHWELPPSRSAAWIEGHWIQSGTGWAWVNGAWNVGSTPQSPGVPPTPPGSPTAAQQGVPTPSGAAPYVPGQYPAGSQPGAVYPVAGATDYGPAVDYSVAYPDYYWAGYPWGWGFFPGALYLGVGGWGYGGHYWGHGGFHGSGFRGGGHFR